MKILLAAAFSAGLLLSACASQQPTPPRHPISVDDAFAQCKQTSANNSDRALFDACMKDKGFQRKTAATEK